MPSVLLITDLLKPRAPLTRLEEEGILSLRVAPTLSQGEEEIAAEFPDFVLVQNRISGLSGEIISKYLRGLLPPRTPVFVLAQNRGDADEMRQALGFCIDLSQGEPELTEAFRACILQEAAPEAPTGHSPPAPTTHLRERTKPETRIITVLLVTAALLCLPVISYFLGKKSALRHPSVPAAVSEPASPAAPSVQGQTAPTALPGPAKAKGR